MDEVEMERRCLERGEGDGLLPLESSTKRDDSKGLDIHHLSLSS